MHVFIYLYALLQVRHVGYTQRPRVRARYRIGSKQRQRDANNTIADSIRERSILRVSKHCDNTNRSHLRCAKLQYPVERPAGENCV